jgi:membrane-associated phospholipid phosphatase
MITHPKIERRYGAGYRPYDLLMACILSLFALFSFLWPNTQGSALAEAGFAPRGFLVGLAFALLALVVLVLAPRDYSRSHWLVRFVRAFYPQALFGFLFMEAIKLSALALGGHSHDDFFAGLDMAAFGMQPAIAFSAALKALPWWNELMFGSYFSYYVLLAITPWLPWLRGDEREAEREISFLSAYMLIVFSFYVFFRVQGPKYWVPELAAIGYADFAGGPITAFMRGVLEGSVLSGAAFPSSHAAGALMLCFFIARTSRRLLPLYGILLVLISLSTVYIRAHWAVDIIGGFVVALALMPLLGLVHRLLGRIGQAP